MDDTELSRRIVDQRIRNRIIEYLQLASSYEAQRAYEQAFPFARVPYEVINQWEDWVRTPTHASVNDVKVFSTAELQAIEGFRPVWEAAAAAAIDDTYPALQDVQALSAWSLLRQQASADYRAFEVRGRLPEDREFEGQRLAPNCQ